MVMYWIFRGLPSLHVFSAEPTTHMSLKATIAVPINIDSRGCRTTICIYDWYEMLLAFFVI